MGLNSTDADDILQDVWMTGSRLPGGIGALEKPKQWLVRVTMNCCLQEHRRRRRFHRAATEIMHSRHDRSSDVSPVESSLVRAEEIEKLRLALREMDDALLQPVVLRYFCDMTSTQVGETLGLNAATVRSRLVKARRTLAAQLAREGIEL